MHKYIKITNIVIILLILLFPLKLSAAESATIEILDIRVQANDDKTTTIIWLTNVPTRGQIVFGYASDDLPYFITDNTGPATRHEAVITTPAAETNYYYKVIAYTDLERLETFVYKIKPPEYDDHIPPTTAI